MKQLICRTVAATLTLGLAGAALAACSSPGDADDAVVTIVVGDRPPADQAESVAALDKSIAAFEKSHPGVKIESVETRWAADTFQAMLAGGTMPTMMSVPFTEPQSLIATGQIADVTEQVDAVGLGEVLNPAVAAIAQADGKTFGVPTDVYSVGLAYNRSLFTDAGLDPDSPPETWDEVRAAAKQISEQTGQAGYSLYTANHFGGWMMSAAVASFGGTIENAEGNASTVDSEPVKEYLQLLSDMRWVDNSMGDSFVNDAQPTLQAFGAGKIGMLLSLPFDYPGLAQQYGMAPEDFGFGSLPQATDEIASLTGGAVQVFSPKASKKEITAALEWLKFNRFEAYTDEETAVEKAKADNADGSIVGLPALSPVKGDTYEQFQSWIKPYVNLPVENFSGYIAVADEQKLIPEPRTKAQDVYADLDTLLQQVLTTENPDIDALVAAASDAVDTTISR
ncbi:extracellular solute-binding protein family 1 [Microbacterium sp. HM58-2]|nr:extracellular solute-binding protein family 1 [Microbacterium sp. HM58-2]